MWCRPGWPRLPPRLRPRRPLPFRRRLQGLRQRRLGGLGRPRDDRRVDIFEPADLMRGEGAFAATVAGEGRPPGEDGPETVAVAGQERDVNEQPADPAR